MTGKHSTDICKCSKQNDFCHIQTINMRKCGRNWLSGMQKYSAFSGLEARLPYHGSDPISSRRQTNV